MPFLKMKQCKILMYKIKHLIRLVKKMTIYKTEGKDICFILYINSFSVNCYFYLFPVTEHFYICHCSILNELLLNSGLMKHLHLEIKCTKCKNLHRLSLP